VFQVSLFTAPSGLKNKRNTTPKKLVIPTIIFIFENTKKSNLKIGPPINILKSFFRKPPGFNVGFGICSNPGEQGKMKKSSLTSCYLLVVHHSKNANTY